MSYKRKDDQPGIKIVKLAGAEAESVITCIEKQSVPPSLFRIAEDMGADVRYPIQGADQNQAIQNQPKPVFQLDHGGKERKRPFHRFGVGECFAFFYRAGGIKVFSCQVKINGIAEYCG